MSYARFGADGSDVYVFLNVNGTLECCGCSLQEREWVDDESSPIFKGYLKSIGEKIKTNFNTTDEMIAHLKFHQKSGQSVPEETFKYLLEDRERNDHWMATYNNKLGEGHDWPQCDCASAESLDT